MADSDDSADFIEQKRSMKPAKRDFGAKPKVVKSAPKKRPINMISDDEEDSPIEVIS